MRQAIPVEVVGNVGEVLVSFLVSVLVTLSLEYTFAVLKTTSKDDLRTSFGHGVVG